MNKRIKKKHVCLGSKRAGRYHCANKIGNHIIRKCTNTGIEPNIRNIKRYLIWFYHNSSQYEWNARVGEASYPDHLFLSTKHLLGQPTDHSPSSEDTNPICNMIDKLFEKRKATKERILSGENVAIADPQNIAHRIITYEEYGTTGKLLSQSKEENNEH